LPFFYGNYRCAVSGGEGGGGFAGAEERPGVDAGACRGVCAGDPDDGHQDEGGTGGDRRGWGRGTDLRRGEGSGDDSSPVGTASRYDAGLSVYGSRCDSGGDAYVVGAGGGAELHLDFDRWRYFDQRHGAAAGQRCEWREAR